MNIAIDVSPLKNRNFLKHRVRGTGFYIESLKKALETYYSENNYLFFKSGDKLRKNIDIVHYPYFEPFFLTLPIFSKYKKIVTVHDLIPLVFPKDFKSGLNGMFRWQLQKLALKKSDMIITDSISSKKDIIKHADIPESKIEIVYLAAGEEFNNCKMSNAKSQIFKEKYNLPDKFVLYVGDATVNKNLPRLMRAITKINVPLVMVGKALVQTDFDKTNPWNRDLVEINNLSENNKKIIRVGFVSKEDLVSFYNAATVFAMPSIYEGFGLPILEAMSCGCPVVASRGGSIPEIAAEACEYVDEYSVDDIAKGIIKVFQSNSIKNQLQKKGLEQAKKFNWKKTVDLTMNVYRKSI
jgi:glycosyltransferase involved in cell wall biosynthesis